MAGSVSSPLERAVGRPGARNHRRVVGRVGPGPVTGVPEVVPAVAFRDEGPLDALLVGQVWVGRPAAEQTARARAAGKGAKILGERLDDDVAAAAPVAPPTSAGPVTEDGRVDVGGGRAAVERPPRVGERPGGRVGE